AMLPRIRPRTFYDLVIEVAIVRPGPIQGDMVHPYLRRREGREPIHYPTPELEAVLGKTLGVPLFQEQAMKVAMVAAEFTSAEANGLRKAMGTFRGDGTLWKYEARMVGRMIARGYDPAFAQRCFEQIKGFGSYGFPESHAVSFARLVYISSWIKCHHPAVFACALLNSQPMGFYAPAQLVRDAQESPQKVEVRPIDVNHSLWDNRLEPTARGADYPALRLGMRQIDGFKEVWADRIVAAREVPFVDVEEMARRTGLEAAAMRKLADADAFRSMGLDRREGLWAVRRLPDDEPLPLFQAARARELGVEAAANLPLMPLKEHIATDYQTTRLSLKGHPMQILRPMFDAERVLSAEAVYAKRHGALVKTAGVVLVRQRPGTGNAVFVTLEDETGVVNILLWARLFETFRREVMAARLMEVEGTVEKSVEGVLHVMARRVIDRSAELGRLSEDYELQVELSRADAVKYPQGPRSP
ncbi:MAG: error-prone DNA polymerase, partial [Brevundimonas sp.]|uniref:helix-hairpin-helix domain-containing protein n=1 Tax=Brevundimonas sp. TaxID=1871086 RepID=UPI00274D151C|nr:error-prone DNA polymerase [Brevundimonas sp.]